MDVMELVRKKKKSLQAQSGRREKTLKPQGGKNRYRILPGWRGGDDPTFFQDFGQHFVKGVDGTLKAVYICAEKTFGKPCAVCEALAEGVNHAENDEQLKALGESKSKGRILMNVLHIDGDDPKTPQILDLTPTTAEKVFELMDEYGDITDLNEGIDIIINRSGKGLNTEYSVMPAAKSKAVDDSVMGNLHNLDEYVQQEYEEGATKAIGAARGISGLLPSSADTPSTSADDAGLDDVLEGELGAEADDADDAYAVADKPAEAVSEDDMSDDELDALLDDLDEAAS